MFRSSRTASSASLFEPPRHQGHQGEEEEKQIKKNSWRFAPILSLLGVLGALVVELLESQHPEAFAQGQQEQGEQAVGDEGLERRRQLDEERQFVDTQRLERFGDLVAPTPDLERAEDLLQSEEKDIGATSPRRDLRLREETEHNPITHPERWEQLQYSPKRSGKAEPVFRRLVI